MIWVECGLALLVFASAVDHVLHYLDRNRNPFE